MTVVSSPDTKNTSRQIHVTRRVTLFAAILLLGSALSYVPVFAQVRAWQILADMLNSALGSFFSFQAYRAAKRGDLRKAARGIIIALLIQPTTHWFLGFNLASLVATSLAVLILSLATWPNQWGRWLSATIGYLFYSFLMVSFSPVAPLPEQYLPALRTSDALTTAIFILLVTIEILRLLPTISIRNRLLLTSISLAFIPALAVTIASVGFGLRTGRTQAINQLTSVAQLKANQINLWQNGLQTELATIISEPEAVLRMSYLLTQQSGAQRATALLQTDQQLQTYLQNSPYFDELFIMDTNGRVVYSTEPRRIGQVQQSDTYFITGMLGPSVQPPTYDPTANTSVVIFSRPIINANGQVLGVFAGRASLNALNDIMLERAGLGETGETYLVGLNRALLTEVRDNPSALLGSRYIRTLGVNRALQEKRNGSDVYPNYAGKDVFGVYFWLPDLQVALLAEQTTDEALRALQNTLFIQGGIALAAILVAILAALWITRSISTPLENLTQAATQVAAGNIEVQAEARGEDEISTVARAFNAMTGRLRSLITSLEERVAERTAEVEARSRQLETVAQIGNVIASIRDLDTLLERVTHLISQQLGFYHVGIFLLDEDGEYAVLSAANSEGGQRMLARGHRLKVGQVGIVGYATGYRRPRIALDVGEDAVFFDNPDLPDTRSEIALPLIAGQTLLGALDVQSTEPNAFSQEDVRILQLLADQLAVAIENARLFTQSQQALEEAQRAYGRLSREAWLHMLASGQRGGYRSAGSGVHPLSGAEDLAPVEQEALRAGKLVLREVEDTQQVAIPIRVRGMTLGVFRTQRPVEQGRWTQEELQTLQNITAELGDALESARLYTETQLRAENERRLGELAAQVRATLDVEDILKTAARRIQDTFGLDEVEIRMEGPAEE